MRSHGIGTNVSVYCKFVSNVQEKNDAKTEKPENFLLMWCIHVEFEKKIISVSVRLIENSNAKRMTDTLPLDKYHTLPRDQ